MYNPYLFYDMMKYPEPFQKEFFAYRESLGTIKSPEKLEFSRAKPCLYMEKYLGLIKKYERLWKLIPYVDALYVSNSMSFNFLREESSIDLFMVVAPGRIWTTRIISTFALWFLGIKKTKKKQKERFCLGFYVTSDSLNLQSIKLQPHDPYLMYRLMHLSPIYQRRHEKPINIYEENYRLRDYFPSFPMEHVISLGNKCVYGGSALKSRIEKMFGNRLGDLIEGIIKIFVLPFLFWKKKKLGISGKGIILSDVMLKFYIDKRKEYAIKWKILIK